MSTSKKSTQLVAPHKKENFRGYTLGELRQQRLLAQIRRDFLKEKITNETHQLLETGFMPKSSGKSSGVLSLAAKSFKIFSYADYFSLGMALFRTGKNIYSLFKRK